MKTLNSSSMTQHALSFLKGKMIRLNDAPFTPKQRELLEVFYQNRINYIKGLL